MADCSAELCSAAAKYQGEPHVVNADPGAPACCVLSLSTAPQGAHVDRTPLRSDRYGCFGMRTDRAAVRYSPRDGVVASFCSALDVSADSSGQYSLMDGPSVADLHRALLRSPHRSEGWRAVLGC